MPVRVIRVLEYEYPDHEAAERDMNCWGVPPNGTGSFKPGHRIRSATMFPAVSEPIEYQPKEQA